MKKNIKFKNPYSKNIKKRKRETLTEDEANECKKKYCPYSGANAMREI